MNSTKSLFWWYESFYNYADPRIRDYPLMGYPHWVVLSFGFYLILATIILPRYMRHRKPIDLQKYTLYLDGILLAIAFFYFMLGCYGWFFLYDWFCQPIDESHSWEALMTVRLCYAFLLTKYIYVIHHVPFVLSKKKSPLINYLLVHHVSFPVMVWVIINFYPGGHATFAGFINATTHVMLFGMKFVVIMFPNAKSWRRHFHFGVHVFQFSSVFLHTIQMYWRNNCGVPMYIIHIETIGALIMASFYYIFIVRRKDSTDIWDKNRERNLNIVESC